MEIDFVKMHGLGNDFMIVRWPAERPAPTLDQVRAWANRRTGVGFDSLLTILPAPDVDSAAGYAVYNADGGQVQQCGNGVRCIASLLARAHDDEFVLASAAGPIRVRAYADGRASVNLGEPRFDPASLPFIAATQAPRYRRSLPGGEAEFAVASLGNPHAVIQVDSVAAAPVGILGPQLAAHPDFPEGVNVGFMECMTRKRIRLRVYERGVGETLACGTGAAAAVAVGRMQNDLAEDVAVELPGGVLSVSWAGPGEPLWQTGPTTLVYQGRIEI